jgi:DNA polymerase-4
MDAFFASVEVGDHPELAGKPVIVGGLPGSRGVVSTASYEARRFGVRSAMSVREAQRLCPHGVFLPVRMSRYAEVSRQIMAILRSAAGMTGSVEPVSVDEAYLDPGGQDPVVTARAVKEQIKRETGLTASVGVAPNKLLAKVASDYGKPDGFTVIRPEDVDAILLPLPVRSLPGVGPKMAQELAALGISTVGQIRRADRGLLEVSLGRRAEELLRLARGEDSRPVAPPAENKSLGAESTFSEDVGDLETLRRQLDDFAAELADRMSKDRVRARTVTIKVRFADFQTITRSETLPHSLAGADELASAAERILRRVERRDRVRLIGLQVSGLVAGPEPEQVRFEFGPPSPEGTP